MLLNDTQITALVKSHGMIEPFLPTLERVDDQGRKIMSRGLSSAGYDVTASDVFLTHRLNEDRASVDPKNTGPDDWRRLGLQNDANGTFVYVPPRGFVLCHTVEYFRLPRNVSCVVTSKSSYARMGLSVLTTVGEPGWEGQYVIELHNTLNDYLRVYAHEGIAQVLFYEIEPPVVSYADRRGKYQGQRGVTLTCM